MAVITDKGVLRIFLEEVRSHVPALEREVARLREPGLPSGAMDEVHRLAHTIRSASEMIGLVHLAEAARGLESLAAEQSGSAQFDHDRLEYGVLSIRTVLDSVQEDGSETAGEATTPQPPALDDVDEEIFGAFSTEAEQLLDQIRAQLQTLGGHAGDPAAAISAMAPLRHAVHTLKGAAGMAGLVTVSGLAHRMEDVLGMIESKILPAEPEIIDLLLSTHDLIGDVVASRGLNGALQGAFESVSERYDLLASLAAEPGAGAPTAPEDDALADVEETDESLLDTFMSEAESHMLLAGDAFRTLATAPADPQPLLAEMRRAAHTIKGASGMVGLMAVSRLAKSMQFLLDALGTRTIRYSPAIYDLLGDTFDLLEAGIGGGRKLRRQRGRLDLRRTRGRRALAGRLIAEGLLQAAEDAGQAFQEGRILSAGFDELRQQVESVAEEIVDCG